MTRTRWDSFVVGAVVLFSLQSRKLDHTQHVTVVVKAHLLISSNYDQSIPGLLEVVKTFTKIKVCAPRTF